MVIQRDCLMPELSDEKVLFLDLLLERPQPLQLVLSGLKGFVGLRGSRVCGTESSLKLLELGIRTFCEFT